MIDSSPIPADAKFRKVIIPTVDTVRYTYLSDKIIKLGAPLLVVGPTGTGGCEGVWEVQEGEVQEGGGTGGRYRRGEEGVLEALVGEGPSSYERYTGPRDGQYTAYMHTARRCLDKRLPTDCPATFCLCAQTGKSVMLQKYLYGLPPDEYVPPNIVGFSARTTANMTQYLIDAKLDRRRKGVFGPPMGKKAVIFIDDLNMPQVS